jgi:hypothetical protein
MKQYYYWTNCPLWYVDRHLHAGDHSVCLIFSLLKHIQEHSTWKFAGVIRQVWVYVNIPDIS